jgi:hypothetical protein
VFKRTQSSPAANHGLLTLFYKGDKAHRGFDSVAFWSDHEIVFVEDAGDTLHTQRMRSTRLICSMCVLVTATRRARHDYRASFA